MEAEVSVFYYIPIYCCMRLICCVIYFYRWWKVSVYFQLTAEQQHTSTLCLKCLKMFVLILIINFLYLNKRERVGVSVLFLHQCANNFSI